MSHPLIVSLDPDVPVANFHMIRAMLDEDDPRPAREQLDKHGGGWRPMHGLTYNEKTHCLEYPGDPPIHPLALMQLHKERILIFEHDVVAIFPLDSFLFEACRMD